jgi:hypothetical protein
VSVAFSWDVEHAQRLADAWEAVAPVRIGGPAIAAGGEFAAGNLLRWLRPKQVFFAYDTPDDLAPLRRAGEMLLRSGYTRASHQLRCYVLVGYPRDAFADAQRRLLETMSAGFLPMAMLWRNHEGRTESCWRDFQRRWARPAAMAKAYREAAA